MNSVARKFVAPDLAALEPTARQPVAPTRLRTKRRYAVRLCAQPEQFAILIEDVGSEAAAVAFAERAAVAGPIMVTDCETGCSESFLLDVDGISIGSC